jgi:hypothetical protein
MPSVSPHKNNHHLAHRKPFSLPSHSFFTPYFTGTFCLAERSALSLITLSIVAVIVSEVGVSPLPCSDEHRCFRGYRLHV